jgi:transposase-like protein
LRKGSQLWKKKRWFSPEFKLDAARRASTEGVIVAQVAKELGVLPAVLYDWVKAYKEKGDRFVVKRPVMPRQFDDAFRNRAVMLAQDPKNVPARVARQLGISKALLSQWLSAKR